MIVKVSIPNRFQFKTAPGFRTMLMQKQGEVHYIGGADILPPPLETEEEGRMIGLLGKLRRSSGPILSDRTQSASGGIYCKENLIIPA